MNAEDFLGKSCTVDVFGRRVFGVIIRINGDKAIIKLEEVFDSPAGPFGIIEVPVSDLWSAEHKANMEANIYSEDRIEFFKRKYGI